jgi:hypothetical protein
VGTCDQFHAGKRLFGLKTLAYETQHRHFAVCPLDALFALRGQIDVFDVVLH